MTFKIIHLSSSNTGCLFTKCQRRGWNIPIPRQRVRVTSVSFISLYATAIPWTSAPRVFAIYMSSCTNEPPLLFVTHHRETVPSKDNEKSACSFAGTQFTPGELLMFLSAILEKLSASMLNGGNSKNVSSSLK